MRKEKNKLVWLDLRDFVECMEVLHGLKIMELIVASLVMTAGLLVGHLSVLVRNRLLVEGTIDPGDEQRLQVTDSPEEAVDLVAGVAMRRFGLGYGPPARRRWDLGE